jgi:hypothetical protein
MESPPLAKQRTIPTFITVYITGKIYHSAFHVTFVSIYYISLALANKLLLATKRAPIEEMWILIDQYLFEDNFHWFSKCMVCRKNSHF